MNLIIPEIKQSVNIKIPAMIMSRTSGYYANLNNMNPGKREEFRERKMINIKEFLK